MNSSRLLFLAPLLALALLGSFAVHADDDPFGYLYTTDSLPKGGWEFEQWSTLRSGKASGTYRAIDFDDEIEYGVTDRFTVSVYLHTFFLHTQNVYDPDDVTSNLPNQNTFDVTGMSSEFRYRVLSPYKDPIGLSLYEEPEIQQRDPLTGEFTEEKALETKIILQKNFLDDLLVLAGNLTFEPEWEHNPDQTSSREGELEGDLGLSYRFLPNWAAGVEFRNIREFNNLFGMQEHMANYLGPNIHYSSTNWWATLTVLPQITGYPQILGVDSSGLVVGDSTANLSEYEKLQIRLKVGIEF